MNIIDDLNWRYAVKKFNEKKVPPEAIHTLKESIQLSPSSYGLQPYKVLIISSKDLKRELLTHSYNQDKVLHCSHLFVFTADKSDAETIVDRYINTYAKTHTTTPELLLDMSKRMKSALSAMSSADLQQWAQQQVFIALGNFLTCAATLKIDTCPMGGFDASAYDQVLGLEARNLTTSVICPIGFRHIEDRNAHKPKVRINMQVLIEER